MILCQSFQVGHVSINFKDPTRTGDLLIPSGIYMPGTRRDIRTEIYHPADCFWRVAVN